MFIETSTKLRAVAGAKGWRTFVMRDSFDAVVEGQRVELARVLSSFNVRVIIRG